MNDSYSTVGKSSLLINNTKLAEDDTDMKEFLEIEKKSNQTPHGANRDSSKSKHKSLLSSRLIEEHMNNTKDVISDSLFAGKITEEKIEESPNINDKPKMLRTVGRLASAKQLQPVDRKNTLEEPQQKMIKHASARVIKMSFPEEDKKTELFVGGQKKNPNNVSHIATRTVNSPKLDLNRRSKPTEQLNIPKKIEKAGSISINDAKSRPQSPKPASHVQSRLTNQPLAESQLLADESKGNRVAAQRTSEIKSNSPSRNFLKKGEGNKKPPLIRHTSPEKETILSQQLGSPKLKLPSDKKPTKSLAGNDTPIKKNDKMLNTPSNNGSKRNSLKVDTINPPLKVQSSNNLGDHESPKDIFFSKDMTPRYEIESKLSIGSAISPIAGPKKSEEARKSMDGGGLDLLKKASFNLLPDQDPSPNNLVNESFEDVLIGGKNTKAKNAKVDVRKPKTAEEAKAQLENILKEHYNQRKEKVIIEMLYLEQYVKKYKEAILTNLEVCMKEALKHLKTAEWARISDFSLITYNLNHTTIEETKMLVKRLYEQQTIDFNKFITKPLDLETQNDTLGDTILDILKATGKSKTPMYKKPFSLGDGNETLDLSIQVESSNKKHIKPTVLKIIDQIRNTKDGLQSIKESNSLKESFGGSLVVSEAETANFRRVSVDSPTRRRDTENPSFSKDVKNQSHDLEKGYRKNDDTSVDKRKNSSEFRLMAKLAELIVHKSSPKNAGSPQTNKSIHQSVQSQGVFLESSKANKG